MSSVVNSFYSERSINGATKIMNHFRSLNLNLKNKSILETGCGGLGINTQTLIEYSEEITLNDARLENIKYLQQNIKRDLKYNT